MECMKTFYVKPVSQKEVGENLLEITLMDRVWILCKTSRKELPTERRRNYTVTYNVEMKEACVCKLFECHGILCRHIIAVYDFNACN